MITVVRWVSFLMQAGEMSLVETKRWSKWAEKEPGEAAAAARFIAGFANHRAYLLRNRRVWFGRERRLARLDSLYAEMTGLADYLDEKATSLTHSAPAQ